MTFSTLCGLVACADILELQDSLFAFSGESQFDGEFREEKEKLLESGGRTSCIAWRGDRHEVR